MPDNQEPEPQPKKYLTADQVAEMFGISTATFYRIRRRGPSRARNRGVSLDLRRIPDAWVAGRHFFSRSAAEKLLDSMFRDRMTKRV